MSYPFTRPNDTSTGGAGGGGCGGSSSGSGRVSIQIPPRARPFPWPLPFSATQGAVGGAGGKGIVQRCVPPCEGHPPAAQRNPGEIGALRRIPIGQAD